MVTTPLSSKTQHVAPSSQATPAPAPEATQPKTTSATTATEATAATAHTPPTSAQARTVATVQIKTADPADLPDVVVHAPRVRSLKDALQSPTQQHTTTTSTDSAVLPLEESSLKTNWDKVVAHYQKEDQQIVYLLSSAQLDIAEPNRLQITVSTRMNFNHLRRLHDQLLVQVKLHFKNPALTLQLELEEKEDEETQINSNLLFTPAQKLAYFQEKNPEVTELIKQLNLEVL